MTPEHPGPGPSSILRLSRPLANLPAGILRGWRRRRLEALTAPGPSRLHGAFLPGFAASGFLVALSALGFSLGSLYAGFAVPSVPVTAAAATVPWAGAGGPEELMAGIAATAAVPTLGVATAARTGVIDRALVAGQDPARPVFWPVVGGWVSSGYGERIDPFTGRAALHRGMDFAGLQNSAVLAAGAGVVSWSGDRTGYGNMIEINHGNGYISRYGHNASNLVAVGDYVKAGQVIALMGATGRASGNHLHFEILRDGRQINPARLVQRGG